MPPIQPAPLSEAEPGNLLGELERRQDDVLRQLDDLEDQLAQVLVGLGITPIQEIDEEMI